MTKEIEVIGNLRCKNEYWVDRNGKEHFYKPQPDDVLCHISSFHAEIALQLFPNEKFPEDKLTKMGWLKMGSFVYECPTIEGEPSQRQIDYLFDLGYIRQEIALNNPNFFYFYK